MKTIAFLFSDYISLERMEFLYQLTKKININRNIKDKINHINLFLTGDALYSTIDTKYQKCWKKILKNSSVKLYIDFYELNIIGGIPEVQLATKYIENYINSTDTYGKLEFWELLINSLHNLSDNPKLSVIQFEGPYMHRSSVYLLRALESAMRLELTPEFYGYLDGVHMGHSSQKPSEFENVGNKLEELNDMLELKNLKFLMLACARCGIARGYIKNEIREGRINSEDVISSYYFCNLNEIIDQFEKDQIFLNNNSAVILDNRSSKPEHDQAKPHIVVFITHSPYNSEWNFGGLSFGIACANHDIHTQIIFIEDGIYTLIGDHSITEEDKIFNAQAIIDATEDLDYLNYFVYMPSVLKRGQKINEQFDFISKIYDNELVEHLLNSNMGDFYHKRVIFF